MQEEIHGIEYCARVQADDVFFSKAKNGIRHDSCKMIASVCLNHSKMHTLFGKNITYKKSAAFKKEEENGN